MKRLRNYMIGIDQGDPILFAEFEDDGEMWTGRGPRERRRRIKFSERYRSPPSVHLTPSLWDMDTSTSLRADVKAETITADGFDIVFRTWGDTRVARARVAWMAIGELSDPEDWDLG